MREFKSAKRFRFAGASEPERWHWVNYLFFFALALCSVAVQAIKRVNALALRAISDVLSSLLASAVRYVTTLLSRKSLRAPVLMAKLMFSGMSPVAFANSNAFSFAAT